MKFTLRFPVVPLFTSLAAVALLLPGAFAQSPSPSKPAAVNANKAKAEATPAAPETSITADGDVSDWKGIDPILSVPSKGATPCDWRKLFLASDKSTLFVRYTTEGSVDFSKGAAYMVLLDTDQSRDTGFQGANGQFSIGADYLLQGTTLYKYTGKGTDWSWQSLGKVPSGTHQNDAEFALSREQLGKTTGVDIILYGDNEAEGVNGKTLDVVPDDAIGGKGKVSYRLK